jgi:hypothetical protein
VDLKYKSVTFFSWNFFLRNCWPCATYIRLRQAPSFFAFVYFDYSKTAKCSIEKAFREGVIPFNKPISCHLYPIRVKEFDDYKALNFEEWKICEPACACGIKLDVPVYRFLKEPLIRAFGERFYEELQIVESELNY